MRGPTVPHRHRAVGRSGGGLTRRERRAFNVVGACRPRNDPGSADRRLPDDPAALRRRQARGGRRPGRRTADGPGDRRRGGRRPRRARARAARARARRRARRGRTTGASRSPRSARGCATASPARCAELPWRAASCTGRRPRGCCARRPRAGRRSSTSTASASSSTSPPTPSARPPSRPRWPTAREREAADVVAAYDFAGLREIVDVGGGSGVLLEAILRATPRCEACSSTARRRWSGPARASTAAGLDGPLPVRGGRLLRLAPARRRRLPALARDPRLGRRRRAADPRDVPRGDARRRAPAARRGDRARARAGRPGSDPDGPPHADALQRPRAHRGAVPAPAGRRGVRAAARRADRVAGRAERLGGTAPRRR